MRIQDKYRKEWYIELNPTQAHYDICELKVEVKLNYAKFTAWSNSVPLNKLSEFIVQFDLFISDRKIEPRLEGAYNSYFSFYSRGNSVFMEFSIGYRSYGPFEFNLKGLFEIETELLLSILLDFKKLAREAY